MKKEKYSNAANSADPDIIARYHAHQRQFADKMHERDKVLLELFAEAAKAIPNNTPDVIDIGCSTGNLLRHIRQRFPQYRLTGVDVAVNFLKENQANPDLKGIEFAEGDIFDLGYREAFDIVVTNAVLFGFSDEEYSEAVRNIAAALKHGGFWLSLDFYHPYEQDISVFEKSTFLPIGRKLYFRSFKSTREMTGRHGLTEPRFIPFSMPIDLPKPESFVDLTSYTVRCEEPDHRLTFAGVLIQPWCHLVAQKK